MSDDQQAELEMKALPGYYTDTSPAPEYQMYPVQDGVDVDLVELEAWQEKQAKILDNWRTDQKNALAAHVERLEAAKKEREDAYWFIAKAITVIVVVAGMIIGGWFFYNAMLSSDQTNYYRSWKSWSDECTLAGGRATGDYDNKQSHNCVFPSGAQLNRKVNTSS